ncbi:MAG: ABC transporter ATP-binding protein [Candidatus Hermodarchaeota archaeon]
MALDDVTFNIPKGKMFGLLGPNGAGKTTTTKIFCTLLYPTSGNASIAGYDVVKDAHQIRPLINMAAGGERMLYFRLTGRENLQYFADLYNLPKLGLKDKLDDLLGKVGLLDRADSPVEQYSKGMRQRLQIARALLNDPIALFLDEPTLGLDVHVARELRKLVKNKVIKENIAVLLTTHYLHEADELCDKIGILDKGRLLAIETPEKLKANYQQSRKIQIITRGTTKEKLKELETVKGIQSVEINSIQNYNNSRKPIWSVSLEITSTEYITSLLRSLLQDLDIQLLEVKQETPSLEDIFVQIIGQGGC